MKIRTKAVFLASFCNTCHTRSNYSSRRTKIVTRYKKNAIISRMWRMGILRRTRGRLINGRRFDPTLKAHQAFHSSAVDELIPDLSERMKRQHWLDTSAGQCEPLWGLICIQSPQTMLDEDECMMHFSGTDQRREINPYPLMTSPIPILISITPLLTEDNAYLTSRAIFRYWIRLCLVRTKNRLAQKGQLQ